MTDTHKVQVDQAAIDDVFATYEQADGQTGEYIPRGEQEPPGENPWQDEAEAFAYLLFGKVTPNWEVPDTKVQKFADALARVGNKVLPGGIVNVDNWGPWGQLAAAAGACAMCGIDWQTLTLKPLSVDPDTDEENTGEPDQTSSGRYTTTG